MNTKIWKLIFNFTPLASIQGSMRLCIDLIKAPICLGASCQIFWMIDFQFSGERSISFSNASFIICHKFSIVFRSGLFTGQSSNTLMLFSRRKFLVDLAVWALAPSCWRTKPRGIGFYLAGDARGEWPDIARHWYGLCSSKDWFDPLKRCLPKSWSRVETWRGVGICLIVSSCSWNTGSMIHREYDSILEWVASPSQDSWCQIRSVDVNRNFHFPVHQAVVWSLMTAVLVWDSEDWAVQEDKASIFLYA